MNLILAVWGLTLYPPSNGPAPAAHADLRVYPCPDAAWFHKSPEISGLGMNSARCVNNIFSIADQVHDSANAVNLQFWRSNLLFVKFCMSHPYQQHQSAAMIHVPSWHSQNPAHLKPWRREYVSIAIHSLTFDAMRYPQFRKQYESVHTFPCHFFLPCGNSTVRDLEKHHVYILGPGKSSN